MPSVIIKPVSGRTYLITPDDNGKILDFGPGATSSNVGTFVFQFNPDAASDYIVKVMGRCWGAAATDAQVPFVPLPYRRVTIANAASDYNIVSADLSGVNLIQVPANWSIGLAVIASVGTCRVVSWDLQGSSAP